MAEKTFKSPLELREEIERDRKEQKRYSKLAFEQSKFGRIARGTEKLLINPAQPSNIAAIQRAPQTILTKEQAMLNALFGQKRQFWGNGQPVQIDNTLTTGNGLIKTGSGDATRRLMF